MITLLLSVFHAGLAAASVPNEGDHEPFKLGVEALLEDRMELIRGKKVGLITNPTGVDRNLNSIVDLLYHHPDVELKALYGPEHGVRGDAQAGVYVPFYIDNKTGLPVYSLYGSTKKPTPEMLAEIDVLLFDIQDVGARFYTYIYTMAYAMEAAKENNIPFIVLDRPNPLGGTKVEGPVLESAYSSFVGMYEIPLRHGMTVGELAKLFNKEFGINCNLTVVKMQGWDRNSYYDELPIPWVMPSPNIPTLDTAIVYPGAALIEGTNASEGRGTTKPFELIGAPFINGTLLAKNLNDLHLPGVRFRTACFIPNTSKHKGVLSCGIQIHVRDRDAYKPIETGIAIVKTIYDMYPTQLTFTNHFNLLTGNGWMMDAIKNGASVEAITTDSRWTNGLEQFKRVRSQYLLYGGSTSLEATLSSASSVYAGEVFDLNYGLSHVSESIYGQDLTFTYDSANVEFIAAERVKDGIEMIKQAVRPGVVRILAVSLGDEHAIRDGGNIFKLRWQAKPGSSGSIAIALSRVIVADGEGGETELEGVIRNIDIMDIVVDKAVLNDLIGRAQSVHQAATEGTQIGQYPIGSKAVLQSAIDLARAVADSASSSQEQVNQAVTDLNNALAAFEASKIVRKVGDLNGDDKISIGDLAIMASHYGKMKDDANWQAIKLADLNDDNVIDILDLSILAKLIL